MLSLSVSEAAAFDRGQLLKRYVRAAAALQGLYDDTAIAELVGRTRIAVGKWWVGVQPEPDALGKLAAATGLSTDELTRFVYFDGPPPRLPAASGPMGLQEGVRRDLEHLNGEDPDTPVPSPGQQPHDDGATRG